ncbi:MAG: hypothetical protein AB8F74_13650, partial [Saprospiraceae bacterium]
MTNRILTSIAFLLLTTLAWGQSCSIPGFTLNTQEEIDNFATDNPGCTEIEGNLHIEGGTGDNITNLNGLSQLTSVTASILIWDTESLTNLSGLDNITTVPGMIQIRGNTALEDISALQNVTSLGSYFRVQDNDALLQVSGFNQLTGFEGSFDISDNASLETFDGFNSLTSISRFDVTGNSSLINIAGFDNISSIQQYVNIGENESLINISFGQQFTSIGTYLDIYENTNLENLEAFSALETVEFDFSINGNESVPSLSYFQSLTSIGGELEIQYNESLDSLWPNPISYIGEDITIHSNSELIDISGLQGISKVNGKLDLVNNIILQDLTGLDNITSVSSIQLNGNNFLSDLSPLSNLDSVYNTFGIAGQPLTLNFQALTNISYINTLSVGTPTNWSNGIQDFSGLESITHLEDLRIIQNPDLTSLNGLQNLEHVDEFQLFDNDGLTDLLLLESITSIQSLSVYSCDALVDFTGLSNVDSIPDFVQIFINDDLESLAGLENVSSIGNLQISNHKELTSLAGLENLTAINGSLTIDKNNVLTDISALSSVDLQTYTSSLIIQENDVLSVCGYENICNYVLTGGDVTIAANAPGCNTLNDLIQSCFEFQDHTSFVGQVIADINMDCIEDADENGLPNSLVNVQNDQYNYTVSADSNGYYDIPVLAGEYTLSVISPSAFWTPCFVDTLLEATAVNDSIQTNFLMVPQGDCPYLDWNLTLPPLRICGSRTITLDYCNLGALPAEDAVFALDFDEFITLDSASTPYTIDANGTIFFELEALDIFDCGSITMSVFLDCDSVEINEVLCVNVELISDELCTPNGLWDESNITASGYCENDSIYFELKNIGSGDMSQDAQFRVDILIEDIVLLHDADDYLLPTGDSILLSYELAGDGFRIEADQTPGHPIYTEASAVVPNCTEMINDLILTLFPTNNGDPFSETFCTFAVNSYDPNIKTAIPRGVGENHEIDKDWELDYTIQFQNTGNDVAYLVTIRDTLSENVDLSTLKVHGATHDFTWALNQNRELVFTFEDINLPDSTSNEPASHGHVSYSILPQKDILPGEEI